jgi:hypothetical protein
MRIAGRAVFVGLGGLVATIGLAAQAPTTKFHVTLAAGPFKGTYDVASEFCDAGLHKPGSWNAKWESERPEKGKLTAILIGLDPKPTFGNGLTAVVEFGGDEHKVLYELQKPVPTVTDRGKTATLAFKGAARVTDYETGNALDGGEAVITIECSKVQRY